MCEGKMLYHGSVVCVEHPLTHVGREDLDFGKGFYTTEIKEQAASWARTLRGRTKTQHTAKLNIYKLDTTVVVAKGYSWLRFPEYDSRWLRFIVASRRGQSPWNAYDIIEGGIANDSVIDTIDAYMSGLIDEAAALGRLAYNKPNNQICILNQKIIDDHLDFIRCEELD